MVEENETRNSPPTGALVCGGTAGCITQLLEALPLTLKEAPMKFNPVSFIITAVLPLIAAWGAALSTPS